MNKELTKKIIEAGIVPEQAVKQLKAWRQLSDDLPEVAQQQVTQELVMGFVHQIAKLLEEDSELPELRETMFDVDGKFATCGQDCTVAVDMSGQHVTINTRALSDKNGLIFEADKYGEVCARIANQVALKDGEVYEITGVTALYRGEAIAYYKCVVQGVPDHAKMPELR